MRCSVHSVRPVSSLERLDFEINNKKDPSKWRSLSDLLPQREFTDLTYQVPGPHDMEEFDLPPAPDETTQLVPLRRARGKQTVPPEEMATPEQRQRLLEEAPPKMTGQIQ